MGDKIFKYDVLPQEDGSIILHNEHETDHCISAPDLKNMIKVNGVWYLDAYPSNIIIELEAGALKMAHVTPMRPLTPDKLRDYKAYHPRKCKGQPLPDYLYRFYGLEKSDETANEVIHVRLTPSEKAKLQTAAGEKTTSEYVRDWIKTL